LLLVDMSLYESLRIAINRLGFDVCRVGPERLGRILPLDLDSLAKGPEIIFDVGANTGRAARFYLKHFPRASVYSFEPFQQSFEALRADGRLASVKAFNVALGSKSEEAILHSFKGSELNSLLALDSKASTFLGADQLEPRQEVSVRVSTLDDFCEEHSIRRIDILKIDTQGYDLEVLRGGRDLIASRRVRVIQVEANFVSLYCGQPSFGELVEYLSEAGYGLVGLYDIARNPAGDVKWADAVFCQKSASESLEADRNLVIQRREKSS
jgi:FkbM family methyltransferase